MKLGKLAKLLKETNNIVEVINFDTNNTSKELIITLYKPCELKIVVNTGLFMNESFSHTVNSKYLFEDYDKNMYDDDINIEIKNKQLYLNGINQGYNKLIDLDINLMNFIKNVREDDLIYKLKVLSRICLGKENINKDFYNEVISYKDGLYTTNGRICSKFNSSVYPFSCHVKIAQKIPAIFKLDNNPFTCYEIDIYSNYYVISGVNIKIYLRKYYLSTLPNISKTLNMYKENNKNEIKLSITDLRNLKKLCRKYKRSKQNNIYNNLLGFYTKDNYLYVFIFDRHDNNILENIRLTSTKTVLPEMTIFHCYEFNKIIENNSHGILYFADNNVTPVFFKGNKSQSICMYAMYHVINKIKKDIKKIGIRG